LILIDFYPGKDGQA